MNRKTLEQFIEYAQSHEPLFISYMEKLKLALDCFPQDEVISFWSLHYVVENVLKLPGIPNANMRYLLVLISVCLEKEKKAKQGNELFENEKKASKFFEEYANKLLRQAQELMKTDRTAASNLDYKASIVFQILNYLYPNKGNRVTSQQKEDCDNHEKVERNIDFCFDNSKQLLPLLEFQNNLEINNESQQQQYARSGISSNFITSLSSLFTTKTAKQSLNNQQEPIIDFNKFMIKK